MPACYSQHSSGLPGPASPMSDSPVDISCSTCSGACSGLSSTQPHLSYACTGSSMGRLMLQRKVAHLSQACCSWLPHACRTPPLALGKLIAAAESDDLDDLIYGSSTMAGLLAWSEN